MSVWASDAGALQPRALAPEVSFDSSTFPTPCSSTGALLKRRCFPALINVVLEITERFPLLPGRKGSGI